MSPQEFELIKALVDVQPVYNLMPVAMAPDVAYPPEVRDFARFKLREAEEQMRAAAKYIRERLGKKDPE